MGNVIQRDCVNMNNLIEITDYEDVSLSVIRTGGAIEDNWYISNTCNTWAGAHAIETKTCSESDSTSYLKRKKKSSDINLISWSSYLKSTNKLQCSSKSNVSDIPNTIKKKYLSTDIKPKNISFNIGANINFQINF